MKRSIFKQAIQVTTAIVILYVFGHMLFEIAETGWKMCVDSVYEIPKMVTQY
jgi:hypothetical protein